jgi:hypothetical protein
LKQFLGAGSSAAAPKRSANAYGEAAKPRVATIFYGPGAADRDEEAWDISGTHVTQLENKNPRFSEVFERASSKKSLEFQKGVAMP